MNLLKKSIITFLLALCMPAHAWWFSSDSIKNWFTPRVAAVTAACVAVGSYCAWKWWFVPRRPHNADLKRGARRQPHQPGNAGMPNKGENNTCEQGKNKTSILLRQRQGVRCLDLQRLHT